ncbi:MAG: hypothetical protein PXX83_02880 [Candidatus Nitrosotalea sp.]|nr:hypothetical protein [Candidatus Nitrosotalea sp.]
MNILHFLSISIIVSVSIYPTFALDTSICDANSLPHYGPHNPSHIYIKDTNGSIPYIPLTYHTAVLHDDDVWNTSTQPRIVQVTLTIQNQDTGQQVFNQTQSLQMQACSGPESVEWRFIPIQIANYIATVSDNRDKENMIFNSMLDATKSQTVSSPLEQLRFGIDSHNVVCKQDLQLVIKSEDGSPACVKSDTVQKLMEKGWAFAGFIRGGGPVNSSTIQVKHADMIVVEDTGTTVIGNQTYYFTTLNDTLTSYHGIAAIPFTFHGVDFTLFPSVFSAGPPESCGDTNFGAAVKFANMTYERLDVHIPGSPCIENYTETAFTNHENSQVGIEDYYGKIRLLVSGDIQPSSALQLSLLVNGQYQNPSEPVGIDVYLNNTTSKPLTLTGSGNWPRNDLTSGMCSNLPFGISILNGYYDEQNMTGAKSLLLYGTAPCPFLPQIESYTFQPFSTKATQECDTLFSCTGLVDMKKHFDVGDYVGDNNPHQPFKTGTYTIIAGDRWGNVAIQHFTEANAVAYDNSSISKGN